MANEERKFLAEAAAHLKKHGFERVSTNADWKQNKGAPQLFFNGDTEAGDRVVSLVWYLAEQHGYIVSHLTRTWSYLGFVKEPPSWCIVFTLPQQQSITLEEALAIGEKPPTEEELLELLRPGTGE